MSDFSHDMSGEAREAFAGWLWHLILPLAPLGVYLALATFRVFSHPDGITAATYMTVGATLWMFYSGLVTGPMSALRSKGQLAAQTGYPLIGVVLTKLVHLLFDTGIRLLMVAAILAWQQPVQQPGIAILAMFAAAPFFLGIGLMLAVFATAVRDLDRIVLLILQYTFFLSFAIFPLPVRAGWIAFNPFAICIDNARHLLVFGALSSPVAFASYVGVGVLALAKGLHFFSRAEPLIKGHL